MRHVIYYFTGTGNTLSLARKTAEKLEGEVELIPVAQFMQSEEAVSEDAAVRAAAGKIETGEAGTVGFFFPIYSSDAPWPMKAAVERMSLPEGAYLYAVADCNARYGLAYDVFNGLLDHLKHRTLDYAEVVKMPGNCHESNAAENQQRLELESFFTDLISRNVNHRFVGTMLNFYTEESSTEATRHKYDKTPFAVWNLAEDRCIGCGICERVCPMANITLVDGKPVFRDRCAYCFACFHFCPQQALYKDMAHFRPEDMRSQYHHPDVTLQDIAAQKE